MRVVVGKSVRDLLETLEAAQYAKALRMLDLLEEYGHALGMPQSRALGGGLFELRVRGTQEVRLFYGFRAGSAAVVHGFVKKTRGTPRKDIELARVRLA